MSPGRDRSLLPLSLLTCAFFLRGLFLSLALPYGDPLDEPFHYGYASYLEETRKVPRISDPSMPADALRPMGWLPRSTSFGGPHPSWAAFDSETASQRDHRRREAFAFRPAERRSFVTWNYEAQQPPFAYLLAAGALRLSPERLDQRLLLLRVLASLAAAITVPLVWLLMRRLLPKGPALAATAAFVAFPGVGSFVGRFSNDALALPIAAALLLLLVDISRGRLSRGKAIVLSALLAIGCWTKLYFLPFLPAAPLAALLSPRRCRLAMIRRSLASSACALLLFVPWMLRERADTGDWLGLMPSRQATGLGLGLLARVSELPGIFRMRFAVVFARTFLWPGTWSAMGAPAALAVALSLVLLLLFLVPGLTGPRSRLRVRSWWPGGLALALFLGAQLAYASTSAAIGRLRGHTPSAGPDGWYSLILFPVILTAGCMLGRAAGSGGFAAAVLFFLAGEWWVTLGVLPGVYGGRALFNGANAPLRAYGTYLLSPRSVMSVFERVGLAAAPAAGLAAVAALWLAALLLGTFFSLRVRPARTPKNEKIRVS